MTDTYSELSEAMQKQIAAERASKRLNDAAIAKREAEEQRIADEAQAAKEAREQAINQKVEDEVRRRFLSTGASPEMWDKEKGRLMGAYREEISLGRQLSADDQARRAFHETSRRAW